MKILMGIDDSKFSGMYYRLLSRSFGLSIYI